MAVHFHMAEPVVFFFFSSTKSCSFVSIFLLMFSDDLCWYSSHVVVARELEVGICLGGEETRRVEVEDVCWRGLGEWKWEGM